jgi:iron complex transport system substrate-binding protein
VLTSKPGAEPPKWLPRSRFFIVPADFIQRHTPRLLEGAELVCRALEEARAARS